VAAYRVLIKALAGRELERLGAKADRRRIVESVQALAEDPPTARVREAGGTTFKIGDRKDV
jgi:hypothetical protein